VSLVFNRGGRLRGSKRREMAAIKTLVLDRDYHGIARQLTLMKRLWGHRGLSGLLKPRDDEAQLILDSQRHYSDHELVPLPL